MSDERKWIVVWTDNFYKHDFADYWRVFEDFNEAEEFYEKTLNSRHTYTVSLSRILKSSDYNAYNDVTLAS